LAATPLVTTWSQYLQRIIRRSRPCPPFFAGERNLVIGRPAYFPTLSDALGALAVGELADQRMTERAPCFCEPLIVRGSHSRHRVNDLAVHRPVRYALD